MDRQKWRKKLGEVGTHLGPFAVNMMMMSHFYFLRYLISCACILSFRLLVKFRVSELPVKVGA